MINPRVDIAFKKIFGVEQNKDILMSLLNAIIGENDQIDEIELLNPYNERNFQKDKLSILDIKARNKLTKTYFLIEMQLAEEMEYHKRTLYSWSRVYANQLKQGQGYKVLTKVIAIHFLNFTCINYSEEEQAVLTMTHKEKYHHCFVPLDKDTHKQIHKDFEIHTLELRKFDNIRNRDLTVTLSKVKTMLDAWMATLTHYDLLNPDYLPQELDKPEIRKALHVMEEMSMTELEREQYEAHLDFLRMEEGAFEARFMKVRAEGKAEGKYEVAKNMLVLGLSVDIIAKATTLTQEEIEQLKE
jgi:predicted transposase/invertase (TIGR01784 family)